MKLGLRTRLEWLIGSLRKLVASRWCSLLARAFLAGSGLVILAAVGRSALARDGATSLEAKGSDPATATVTVAATGPPSPDSVSPTDAGFASPSSDAPRGRATPADPVILNQATLEDLRRLPGIGPKKGLSILALRQRMGHFRQVEDLLKVKGIGRSTLKKLRPLIRIDRAGDAAP